MISLSEQLVNVIFNDALCRLGIKHIAPLPVSGNNNNLAPAVAVSQNQNETILVAVLPHPRQPQKAQQSQDQGSPPQQQQQQQQRQEPRQRQDQQRQDQQPQEPRQRQEQQKSQPSRPLSSEKKKTRSKRRRPNSDPVDLDAVLLERHALYPIDDAQQQQQQEESGGGGGGQKARDLPTKRYSCAKYAPEFLEWLDRVVAGLYTDLEKRSLTVDGECAQNREVYGRVVEATKLTLPLDMRCTGCRRNYLLKSLTDTATAQKSMTHATDSTRASHCLRCRVIDWAVSGYKDSLNPRRLVVVPVVAPGYVAPSRSEEKKRKLESSSSSPSI